MNELEFFQTLLSTSQVHKTAARRIRVALQQGLYVMLAGPLLSGKSEALSAALTVMANMGYPTVSIDLGGYSSCASPGHLYAGLIRQVRATLFKAGSETPAAELASSEFVDAFNQISTELGQTFVLGLDTLEALPNDFIPPLLRSLRHIYNDQQSRPARGLIVLAGALDLADKAVGPTSPFNIAQLVVLSGIDPRDGVKLIRDELDHYGLEISQNAVQELHQAGEGDAFLLHQLCQYSIHWMLSTGSRDLNVADVRVLVDRFIQEEARKYKVLEVPFHRVEGDCHLLDAVLKILAQGETPIRDLPIDLTPLLDPLYLTGLVTRTPENKYRIRNTIYRRVLQERFNPVYAADSFATLGCWEKALALLAGKPGPLANLIGRAMAAAPETTTDYLFRGLKDAFGISRAELWLANDDRSVLECIGSYGTEEAGEAPPGQGSLDAPLDVHQALDQNEIIRTPAVSSAEFIRAIPLPLHSRSCMALRLAMPRDGYLEQISGDGEQRLLTFLSNTTQLLTSHLALHTAENSSPSQRKPRQSRGRKDRRRQKLKILSEVIKMLQRLDAERALHVILTAITAHWGLEYNRVWLFLVDSPNNCFSGRMAIGAHSLKENQKIWEQVGRFPYKEYKDRILSGAAIDWPPIDAPTRSLSLPRDPAGGDLFSYAAIHPEIESVKTGPERRLPEKFAKLFSLEDATAVPLVPTYGGQCIGLLVAANFPDNPAPAATDPELLTVYSNLIASVLTTESKHSQEVQKTRLANTLRDLTFQITQISDKEKIAERILEEMNRLLPFNTASIQLYDPKTSSLRILAGRGFPRPTEVLKLEFPVSESVFPNVTVWNTGGSMLLADVQQEYPHFADPQFQVETAHGWICVNLKVDLDGQDWEERKPLGVITLENPNKAGYSSDDLDLAKIFANVAAVALDNADRFERLAQLNRDLVNVQNAVEAMVQQVSGGDPHGRMELLVQTACRATGADCAVVYPVNTGADTRYNPHTIAHTGLLRPEIFNPTDDDFQSTGNPNYSLLGKDELFIDDVQKLDRELLEPERFLRREEIQAFAGVRVDAGELSALLYVSWRTAHRFDAAEMQSICRFASLAGAILLNASVLDEKIQELELLEKLDLKFSSIIDLNAVAKAVGEAAQAVAKADRSTVYLLSDDRKRLESIYPDGEKIVIVPQTADLSAITPFFTRDMRDSHQQVMGSPGDEIGLVVVESRTANAFTDKHKRLLKALAVDAALAVRNAQYVKKLRRASQENAIQSHHAQIGALSEDFRHKVQQKLAGVDNITNGLRTFLARVGPPADPAATDLARQAIDSLEKVLRQVRTIEAVKDPKAGGPVEVDAEINKIIEAHCPPEPRFQVNFDPHCPGEYANLGPEALKTIIGNLMDNAIRHLPSSGGSLNLATSLEGDEIVITIQDNGPGMSAEDWEQYLRGLLPGTREEGHGRGGLIAIYYTIRVGGWIEKVSNGPDGVRLDVRLPRAGSLLGSRR